MSNREIRLYWWRGENFTNFGDEINPHIVNYVSGVKTVRAEIHKADLVSIGSVLHKTQETKAKYIKKLLSKEFYIWGSGTLEPIQFNNEIILNPSLLRGPLTASLFKKDLGHIKYGDPGLLASAVWEVSNKSKKYKWGLIVHHSQYEKKWIKKLLNNSNVLFIDIKDQDLRSIMLKINQCEYIASTSLHGLIIADSYNIPNFWLWDDNLHRGGEWKFMDYMLSVKRDLYEQYNPNLINSLDDIDLNKNFAYLKGIDAIKSGICQTFPKEFI